LNVRYIYLYTFIEYPIEYFVEDILLKFGRYNKESAVEINSDARQTFAFKNITLRKETECLKRVYFVE